MCQCAWGCNGCTKPLPLFVGLRSQRRNTPARVNTRYTELALADLETVEKALLKAEKLAKSGDKMAKARAALLVRVRDQLDSGAPVRAMDYIFLRAGAPGRATGLHYDFPFFTRATPLVYTVWLPLGPVPVTDGPVAVVEGSHVFDDILDSLAGFDIARDKTRQAEVSHDPVAFAEARGCRLLTTDFAAGDILVFDIQLDSVHKFIP